MRVTRRLSPASILALSVVLALTSFAAAQSAQNAPASHHVKNFGCISEAYYRGAQPKKCDYAELAAMGVKTIIDLQRDGERDEQKLAEAAHLKFYRIPMSDKEAPAPEQVEEFLKIVNDPANQPVFVHCRGGRHRTGAMTAIYRMTHDGWNADRAYAEMKQFDFEYGMGHGALKSYVFDYYTQMEQKGLVVHTHNENK